MLSETTLLTYLKNYEKAIELISKVLFMPNIDKCAIWSCVGKLFVQVIICLKVITQENRRCFVDHIKLNLNIYSLLEFDQELIPEIAKNDHFGQRVKHGKKSISWSKLKSYAKLNMGILV